MERDAARFVRLLVRDCEGEEAELLRLLVDYCRVLYVYIMKRCVRGRSISGDDARFIEVDGEFR